MIRKRILTAALAGLMAVSMCACGSEDSGNSSTFDNASNPSGSSAAGEKTPTADYVTPPELNFQWEEVEGGVKITHYDGEAKCVLVPSQLGGQDVLELETGAFPADTVTRVKISDTVQTISSKAFSCSGALVAVEMGKNVKKIDENAFVACVNLSEVILNDGLKEIGDSAFMQCTSLKHIEIPSSVKTIEGGAFFYTGLEEIEIPGSVKYIGDQAFQACPELKTVLLHEGIETIDDEAFADCKNLERVDVAASIQTYEYDVFGSCPKSVLYIYAGSPAEEYAKEYEYPVEIKTTAPEPIPETAATTEPIEVRNYTIPEESDFRWEETENGVAITEYRGKYKNVIIPSTLGGKPVVALRDHSIKVDHLEGLKLPDTVTAIEKDFLSYNDNITEVELGKGVKVIEDYAFSGCANLSSVILNEGLETIGIDAFTHCYALKSITFPTTLVEIGDLAFWKSGLEHVTIPGNVKIVGESAFYCIDSLKSAKLEEGVEVIKHASFSSCDNLERVEIPASATNIEQFLDNKSDVIIAAPAGSKAEAFAE